MENWNKSLELNVGMFMIKDIIINIWDFLKHQFMN